VAAGYDVEMPRLPGHGTHVDDMIPTRWDDYVAEVEGAYRRLAARSDKVVVAGLSMGGALTLRMGADHPEIAGLICINAATAPIGLEDMVPVMQQMLDAGEEVAPGIGSDIADPGATESAYEGAPIRAMLSLIEGLQELAPKYPEMHVPLLILESPQDHVVPPGHQDYLAANYGGPVERIVLERSYHVATQDFDKQVIFDSSVEFAKKVTAS
jgi:carboxylesterase